MKARAARSLARPCRGEEQLLPCAARKSKSGIFLQHRHSLIVVLAAAKQGVLRVPQLAAVQAVGGICFIEKEAASCGEGTARAQPEQQTAVGAAEGAAWNTLWCAPIG